MIYDSARIGRKHGVVSNNKAVVAPEPHAIKEKYHDVEWLCYCPALLLELFFNVISATSRNPSNCS